MAGAGGVVFAEVRAAGDVARAVSGGGGCCAALISAASAGLFLGAAGFVSVVEAGLGGFTGRVVCVLDCGSSVSRAMEAMDFFAGLGRGEWGVVCDSGEVLYGELYRHSVSRSCALYRTRPKFI